MSSGTVPQPRNRRSLFWRLWVRSLVVRRPQAALATGSLLVGAAVTAMLLNLYGGVRRKMTQEFRAYGPNVVVAPRAATSAAAGLEGVMDEGVLSRLASFRERLPGLAFAPALYVVARLKPLPADPRLPEFQNVVAVGTDFAALRGMSPGWRLAGEERGRAGVLQAAECIVGAHVAARLHLGAGDRVELETVAQARPGAQACRVIAVLSAGAAEDDQVFVPLGALQRLAGLEGKISLVELSVPGETADIERGFRELSVTLQGVELRPIRQIVYAEGKVLETIRWLLISLTALILVIIGLCVMATMTAIVLERRKDIAVMKALGATDRLVVQLFLSEGASLGLLGGGTGFGLGVLLARELARRLFGVALGLAWWTLPLVCFLSVVLAVVATLFPVNIARSVQPASVLKGE